MAEDDFRPICIMDVDLDDTLPMIPDTHAETGQRYGGVFCLVRKSGRPIGVVEFQLMGDVLSPGLLALHIVRSIDISASPPRTARPSTATRSVTVVIATRDRAAKLTLCLDSILKQSHQRFDVVVVDNAPSSDETAKLIADRYAGTGKVRYVLEERPGLGRAHNSGLEHVTAPVVAFTDDDVIADRNWLSALVSNFDDLGHTGCVTGLILPAELDTRAQLWTERHGGFGKGFERKVFDLAENRPEGALFPYTAGQFGSGASMAFSTKALREIGGFDPALGAGTQARGGDDLAAFFGVVHAGYQLVYEPESIVWHHHRRSEDEMQRQAFGYGMGLGAYLTKVIVETPRAVIDLAINIPAGIAHMVGSTSPKNRRLPDDYPSGLIWRERLGILNGVVAYLRSRHGVGRQPLAEGKPLHTWVR